jgi:hypothetical protein
MSVNGNKRKSEQLGMPHGTATARLKKMVLFHLVQQLGQDACYHCQGRIKTVGEFSIEHKKPWLDKDPRLFWDLENVAFSHLSCNARAADRSNTLPLARSARRKVGPAGTAWCNICKAFLPMGEFSANSSRWNGLQKACKSCCQSRTRSAAT